MTGKTRHPAAGCTKAQIATFERICVNDEAVNPKVAMALVRKGLVTRHENTAPFYGALSMTIYRYSVPADIHLQWCRWCAEQPHEEFE